MRARLAVCCLAAAALGQDLLTPGEQVLKGLRAALAKGDDPTASRLLGEIGGLYRHPASEAEADALLKLAGKATKSKSEPVRVAALLAIGEAGAPGGAALIEPFLRTEGAAGKGGDVLAAVLAAGRLRARAVIEPLYKLAMRSADMTVADQAFVALGGFARSPAALRKHVTEKVLDACQRVSRDRRRWRRLRAPGLRALQRLIGRRMNSVTLFADWWRRVR